MITMIADLAVKKEAGKILFSGTINVKSKEDADLLNKTMFSLQNIRASPDGMNLKIQIGRK